MTHTATKLSFQEWAFRGWIIEKMECGIWNMRPESEDFWTDSADTLKEAKTMINRFEG